MEHVRLVSYITIHYTVTRAVVNENRGHFVKKSRFPKEAICESAENKGNLLKMQNCTVQWAWK